MIPLFLDANAPVAIHGVTTPHARNPIKNKITYNGLTLNNPTDDENNTYVVEQIEISAAYDEIVEPNADRDGSAAGPPREVQKLIEIAGWVKATSLAGLYDKIAALNEAFNPVMVYLDDYENSDFDIGFLPLTFATPTTDTATWPLGYILQQYYARPIRLPFTVSTKFDDLNARFRIVLRTVDPRKYEQSLSTATGLTGNGTLVADNSKSTYPSWPILKLTFTTAAAADFTIARSQEPNFNRTLHFESTEMASLSGGDTLVIDMQKRVAYLEADGSDLNFVLKGYSRFFDLLPESNSIVVTGAPADMETEIEWRRAFI